MSRITQKGQSAPLSLNTGGSFPVSDDKNLSTLVGTRYDLSDGREVIFVSVGATAIGTSGLLCQDAAIVANHQNTTVGTYTAYSASGNVPASVILTIGATALTKDQYQGGFAVVNAATGIGQTLRIASNSAGLASSTVATVTFEDAPNVALVASASNIDLIPPHGANVVAFPIAATGAAVGVTLYPLTAGIAAGATTGTANFGFLTSKGLTASLSDAGVASAGQAIAPSVLVVGATRLASGTQAVVGYANQTAVSAEARSVFVNL